MLVLQHSCCCQDCVSHACVSAARHTVLRDISSAKQHMSASLKNSYCWLAAVIQCCRCTAHLHCCCTCNMSAAH
eukprot:8145-Heterococcus_DN1.PRE.1